MGLLSTLEAQQVAEERIKEALRKAEQARLIRAAIGHRKPKALRRRFPVVSFLVSQLRITTR